MRNFRIQRIRPTFGDRGVGRAYDAIDQDLEYGCVFLAVVQQVRLTESPVLRRQGRRY